VPFLDRASLNKAHLQDAARDRVTATMAARAATAVAAVKLAVHLRARVGLVSRALAMIGLETPAVQRAAEAVREAEQAQQAAKGSRLDYRDDLAQADRSAAAEAERRQREQERWEKRPDVRAARREDHGTRLVAAALRSGDPEIKDILKEEDGLRLAREMLLRREAERLAVEQQAQQDHRERQHAESYDPSADIKFGGPGRR
jgi:hypothetical protein